MTNTELHELIERLGAQEIIGYWDDGYVAVGGEAQYVSRPATPRTRPYNRDGAAASTAIAQLIERNEALEEALRECRELFTEIRNDWYDPRSQCREGCRIIDTALSASLE